MSEKARLRVVPCDDLGSYKRKQKSKTQREKKKTRAGWLKVFREALEEHLRLVAESKGPASVSGMAILYAGQDGRFGRWFGFSHGRDRLALLAACEMLRAEILEMLREDVRPRTEGAR